MSKMGGILSSMNPASGAGLNHSGDSDGGGGGGGGGGSGGGGKIFGGGTLEFGAFPNADVLQSFLKAFGADSPLAANLCKLLSSLSQASEAFKLFSAINLPNMVALEGLALIKGVPTPAQGAGIKGGGGGKGH